MTFESGLGTSYDTSLVKLIEVSYVLIESTSTTTTNCPCIIYTISCRPPAPP